MHKAVQAKAIDRGISGKTTLCHCRQKTGERERRLTAEDTHHCLLCPSAMRNPPFRVTSLPDISSAPLPVAYARARQELAKCWRVDECKTRADKMQALASYAKQSRDKGLYEVALRIQARASRRCGELLKEVDAKPGARTDLEPGAPHP